MLDFVRYKSTSGSSKNMNHNFIPCEYFDKLDLSTVTFAALFSQTTYWESGRPVTEDLMIEFINLVCKYFNHYYGKQNCMGADYVFGGPKPNRFHFSSPSENELLIAISFPLMNQIFY